MNTRIATAGLALLMAIGSPALAQMASTEGGTMTCGEFLSGDAAAKNAAVGAVRVFVKESVNADQVGTAGAAADLEDEELMGRLDQGCTGSPETLTLIDALKK